MLYGEDISTFQAGLHIATLDVRGHYSIASGHVQKSICQHLIKLTDKLRRLERIGQDSDVMENITYLVELIAKIKD